MTMAMKESMVEVMVTSRDEEKVDRALPMQALKPISSNKKQDSYIKGMPRAPSLGSVRGSFVTMSSITLPWSISGDTEDARFFTKDCTCAFFMLLIPFTVLVGLSALIASQLGILGLFLLAILPGCLILLALIKMVLLSVTVYYRLLAIGAGLIIGSMAFLLIVENILIYFLVTRTGLPADGGLQGLALVTSFLQPSLAAMLEEICKYVAVRALLLWPQVQHDVRSLIVYSTCVGATFATIENLTCYAFFSSILDSVTRAYLTVPLHCLTGFLMGVLIAEGRLSSCVDGRQRERWYTTLAIVMLIHGTYDIAIFLFSSSFVLLGYVANVLTIVAGLALARHKMLRVLRLHSEALIDLTQAGTRRSSMMTSAVFASSSMVVDERRYDGAEEVEEESGGEAVAAPYEHQLGGGGGGGGGNDVVVDERKGPPSWREVWRVAVPACLTMGVALYLLYAQQFWVRSYS